MKVNLSADTRGRQTHVYNKVAVSHNQRERNVLVPVYLLSPQLLKDNIFKQNDFNQHNTAVIIKPQKYYTENFYFFYKNRHHK